MNMVQSRSSTGFNRAGAHTTAAMLAGYARARALLFQAAQHRRGQYAEAAAARLKRAGE